MPETIEVEFHQNPEGHLIANAITTNRTEIDLNSPERALQKIEGYRLKNGLMCALAIGAHALLGAVGIVGASELIKLYPEPTFNEPALRAISVAILLNVGYRIFKAFETLNAKRELMDVVEKAFTTNLRDKLQGAFNPNPSLGKLD